MSLGASLLADYGLFAPFQLSASGDQPYHLQRMLDPSPSSRFAASVNCFRSFWGS